MGKGEEPGLRPGTLQTEGGSGRRGRATVAEQDCGVTQRKAGRLWQGKGKSRIKRKRCALQAESYGAPAWAPAPIAWWLRKARLLHYTDLFLTRKMESEEYWRHGSPLGLLPAECLCHFSKFLFSVLISSIILLPHLVPFAKVLLLNCLKLLSDDLHQDVGNGQ